MKKLLLTMTLLLATVGAWAQETTPVVADGVYTIENVYNGRGAMCFGMYNSTEYFGLAGITLVSGRNDYTVNSVTVAEEDVAKKYWYVKTTANATYIYNIGKGVFLQGRSGGTATCEEVPGELELVNQTKSGTDYVNIKSSTYYMSFSCGYNPAQGQFRWGGLDEGGSQLTFAAVENAATTYAAQIADADAFIADYESVEADVKVSYSGASSWTQTAVYPEALESIPDHIGTAGHTVYKKGTMVSVKNAGDRTVTFVYKDGSDGIYVLGADLVNSAGTVVASDYHAGKIGSSAQNNVYTLASVPAGTYLLRFFVCNDGRNKVGSHTGEATVTSVIEPSQASQTAYFNSLKTTGTNKYASCNHATNNGKPGYYTQATLTALNDANTAAAGVDADAVTVADVFPLAEAIEHLQVVLPAPGKFYRIAYDFGGTNGVNYLQGMNVTVAQKGEAAPYSSEDGASSIFYYSNDGKLLSYTAGRYLAVNNNSRGLVGVGVAGANATFAASPRTLGKLTLYMGSYVHANTSGSILFVDRCASDGCANHDHIVTEVTTLPVTISAAGYSTLYSPVALTLPDNENVKAYYVTATTSANATLAEITDRVIPANAGVILSGPEGTYDLTIGGEATANENNKLTGTVASAYIADDAYVLSNKNGIGLYLAAKNQENNTKWLNNGFKAYMLTSQVPNGAPALTFDFGTETGIGNIANTENAVGKAVMYDLSGRRVKSAQKGIFIINGKKVVK